MRGWLPLYRTSIALGARHLLRHGYEREAAIRVLVPLDPSRYLELPYALDALGARAGDRVLDLASPKLLAAELSRRGVDVTSVDEHEPELARWRRLAPGVRFERADGRALPYEHGAFEHACSISVLEHIADGGDEQALRELARVVKPGGRVVITLPHARDAWDEYRDAPLYEDHGPSPNGRYFFQRWYDDPRVDALVAAAPELATERRDVVRLQPNLNAAYNRLFPWLVPLGPLFGLLARERADAGGDVVRLTLTRR